MGSGGTQFAFAILDVRRFIHLAILIGGIAAVHAYGPPQLQVPVDQYLITPLLRASTQLQRQLWSGAAAVYVAGHLPGTGDGARQ